MEKRQVIIGRKWARPEIYALVTDEKFELQIELAAFLDALLVEMGSPVGIMTKSGLRSRLLKAAGVVVEGVKAESIQVV